MNLLREELSLPAAVLLESRLAHNLDWMRRFVEGYRVALCPHGKTTMAPKLFHRQLQAGAWGITLATAAQVRVAYVHGVRRVILANQLIGRRNMAIIADLLRDPLFGLYALVDSAAGVDLLGAFFAERGQTIDVLIEVGASGGRAGVRDDGALEAVLSALDRWPAVRLKGVELFEGVFSEEEAVRTFLERAVGIARRLVDEGRLGEGFVLSGAGSSWFDVVAETFTAAEFGVPAQVVLRPGCYLTHDVGVYRKDAARMATSNAVVRELGEGLRPALQVWAYVLSRPEPDVAVVGVGKRDASFDAGLPVPVLRYRPGSPAPTGVPEGWRVERMMDQHAVLRVDGDLRVGDMVGFDVSHPCLTFDRWRHLFVVDEAYEVIDVVETFFRPGTPFG